MEWLKWWSSAAEFVTWQAIMVGTIIWLYQGAYDLATRTNLRKATLRVLAAGAVCIGLGVMSFWVAKKTGSLLPTSVTIFDKQPPASWGEGSPPEEREKSSRIMASLAFRESGRIFKYVGRDGVWREYCPTPEDATLIAEKAKVYANLATVSEQSFDSAIRMWATGGTALLLGFGVAMIKKSSNGKSGR
jgi:hypothetical protein